MSRAAAPRTTRRTILAVVLLFLPVLIATAYTVVSDLEVARAWSAEGEVTGAPAATATTSQELIDARRAAGEAGAQAGFLTTGTGELTAGTGELIDGAAPLEEGVGAAAAGAQELHEGLIQLQAGTGQLGAGATEIADGVAAAMEQVNGVGATQQQLLDAITHADAVLADSDIPEAGQLREQLSLIRGQLEQFGISEEMSGQLNDLRTGTRDLANQLNVPGYGFHDGMYAATRGAGELAAGLGELESGVDTAVEGFQALDEGARRIDSMATLNEEKTAAVQRALPVAQVAGGSGEIAAASDEARSTALAPMYAFLISTLVMIAGAAIGWASLRNRMLPAFALLGVTAIGGIILFTVALGMSAAALAGAVGILLLATLAAAVLTRVLVQLFGATGAFITAVVGWVVQVAVVAHVWSATAASEIAGFWQVLAGLMPLHYPTFAITAIGNGGAGAPIWMGVAVLAALLLVGLAVLRRGRVEVQED